MTLVRGHLDGPVVAVVEADPFSAPAREMIDALWVAIQDMYGFRARTNPIDSGAFRGSVGRFWLALDGSRPVGAVGLTALDESVAPRSVAELDAMYVAPAARGTGTADALVSALEEHARSVGVSTVWLRCGEPQAAAMRFYARRGFRPVPAFGKWVGDGSARCLGRTLRAPAVRAAGGDAP